MNPPRRWHQSLAARYGAVILLFVALGSLLLLAWLRHQQLEEARRLFVTVAQNDADFVRRLNLPRSAKLAEDLRQLLRMDIHFRPLKGAVEPALTSADAGLLLPRRAGMETIPLPGGREALILILDLQHDMIFIRDVPQMTLTLWHTATRNALIAFWLFSAFFAWVIGLQVVGPVGKLMRGLKGFFGDTGRQLPETARRDEFGDLARALTQVREELVTERERREQSERLALLGRVATGLAHEIKNPLASIQLHAQLIESLDLDDESQASLKHLLAEVRVIEGLVNQWLFLARPASPKKQPLQVMDVLQETVQMLQPQADHAGVTLHLAPAPAMETEGDRMRLQQVFRNIMVNAIQAMPSGGKLDISIAGSADSLTITFHDQGPGFSPDALGHGAELFFSEKEGGMGVGLNVAQEIISAHNGQILLKNHPKSGALVEITLPMSKS